jgi:Protein of unknown function (DUF3604)
MVDNRCTTHITLKGLAAGFPELVTVWKDPDFDPGLRAFYHIRVIEIPTPRCTTFDAKHFGIAMDPKVPMTMQERAYTSLIRYTSGT